MDLEQRLQSHMSEFADRVELPAGEGPDAIQQRGNGGHHRAITAIAVLLMAGTGFLLLSNSGAPDTSVAAGEVEGEGDEVTTIDVSSPNAPASGKVESDDGIYYVLSTAPGKVDLDGELSEEELRKVTRSNTFYVLDENREWQTNQIEDRLISDFDVNNGVLYVLSTGTLTTEEASFGTSTDRGASWDWTPIDSMPDAVDVDLLVTDETTLIFASRWSAVDNSWAIDQAADVGLNLSDKYLLYVDTEGFSYLPVDPNDGCAVAVALETAYLKEVYRDIESVESTETEVAIGKLEQVIGQVENNLTALGCEFSSGWAEPDNLPDTPEPVELAWSDIGVDVPEDRAAWVRLYSLDGTTLTQQDVPFAEQATGWATVANDELQVTLTEPDDYGREVSGVGTRWTTGDGVMWDSRQLDPNDEASYDSDGHLPPSVGQYRFRLRWDDSQPTQDEALIDVQTDIGPEPLLQRSISGGEWETIDPASLLPGLDVGDRRPVLVRGSSLGVMLFLAETPSQGNPALGSTVLFTSDGVDWQQFELEGSTSELYDGDDEALILSTEWRMRAGEVTGRSQAVLVQPAG